MLRWRGVQQPFGARHVISTHNAPSALQWNMRDVQHDNLLYAC
jgi:hypothetical protein